MTATTACDIRRNQSAEPYEADKLVKQACVVLDNFGVAISRSKVSRLVRTFKRRVEPKGFDFAAFMANQLELAAIERRIVADELRRVVAYADPTGEQAVEHVIREAR